MIGKLVSSIICAVEGLVFAFKTQQNFRIEVIFLIVCIFTYINLNLTLCEWMIGIGAFSFLIFSELINTTIELICDSVSIKYNLRIKHIKDISAGCVLIVFGMVISVNSFIIYNHLEEINIYL